MMTRRERLEARLERRREWAGKRMEKVAAVTAEQEKYRGDVAFNTQPGHIPERARLIAREERAFGSGGDYQMAQHHESKAAGLERYLDHAIFSDDEDAPERLQARIAELERKRAAIKAANAAYRKGDEAFAAALGITVEQAKARRETIEAGYSWCRQPHPTYELTNLGANIRRLKERLQTVALRRDRQAQAEAAGGVLVKRDGLYATVTFDEKPAREILNALREAGFHWSGGSWHGYFEKVPAAVLELAKV